MDLFSRSQPAGRHHRRAIRRGYNVMTFNQRSVAEILQMIRVLGAMVGLADQGIALAAKLESDLETIRTAAASFTRRPRVFFEEWDTPLISGIRWVEELVEIAGGDPIFPDLRNALLAKNRIVDPDRVREADPEVIFASWCGKKVRPATIVGRPGWHDVAAVQRGDIYEIKSTFILQPGPASLTDGVAQLHERLLKWSQSALNN